MFDVGEEAHAIDRTVEDGGGREAGHAQGGEKGRRVPAAVGGVVDHALAPLPTPVAANQVGPPATFIQKHEPRVIPGRGGLLPRRPSLCHVRTGVAEARALFFVRRKPSFVTARQIVGRLAAVGHACCHSTSVRSGCSRIRIASRGTCACRSGVWRRGAISPVSRRRCFRRSTHARLTAYFSATSFDAMPASLSLSTRVRKSRAYAALSALLPQEYHDRVLGTSEIRARWPPSTPKGSVAQRPYTNSTFTRRQTIAADRCRLPSVMSFFGSSSRSTWGRLVFSSVAILFLEMFEPPRVSERLHVLGGWGPWEDRGSTHQRSGSERCDWCSITSISTTRSGRRFGSKYAGRLRRRRGRLGDTWHLDELFVTIQGRRSDCLLHDLFKATSRRWLKLQHNHARRPGLRSCVRPGACGGILPDTFRLECGVAHRREFVVDWKVGILRRPCVEVCIGPLFINAARPQMGDPSTVRLLARHRMRTDGHVGVDEDAAGAERSVNACIEPAFAGPW